LRDNLKAVDDRIDSATAFIENVASRSSVTGKDYENRFPDGRTVSARNFLLEELSRIQRPPATR
jgi:Family of unknown function (DUF5329)